METIVRTRVALGGPFLAAALLGGCSGAGQAAASIPVQGEAQASQSAARTSSQPFAQTELKAHLAASLSGGGSRPGDHIELAPSKSKSGYIIASSADGAGEVDVFEAGSGKLLGACTTCGGGGVAVNRTNGEFAVGSLGSTVSVFKGTPQRFTRVASLALSGSNGWLPNALGYDNEGGLYVGNVLDNQIAYFTAKTIAAGGGNADYTLYCPEVVSTFYLVAEGHGNLIVDGPQASNGDAVVAEIEGALKSKSTYVVLQQQPQASFDPGGLALDAAQNLIVNNQFGSVSTYAPPWSGSPTATLDWSDGHTDYTGIALDATQKHLLLAGSNDYSLSGDVAWFGYDPLGKQDGSTKTYAGELYVAVGYLQAK